jgi:hypothetical protein
MSGKIVVVNGSYALEYNGAIVGVVERINDTQWGFYPLVQGYGCGVQTYIPLHYALEEALKFTPNAP